MRKCGMWCLMLCILVFCCEIFLGTLGFADVIYLKDGQTRKGSIVEQKDGYVIYERDGKKYKVKEDDVEDIKMDVADESQSGSVGLEKILKLGLDVGGKHEYANPEESGSMDVDSSITMAGEVVKYFDKGFGLGGGMAYLLERGYDTDVEEVNPKFSFIPVYGIVKYRFPLQNISGFAEGQIGYNFLDGNSDYTGGGVVEQEGGLYYGLGGGVNITKNIFLGIYYSAHNGMLSWPGMEFFGQRIGEIEWEVKYTKFSLTAGYNF